MGTPATEARIIYRAAILTPEKTYYLLYDHEVGIAEVTKKVTSMIGDIHITDVFPALGIAEPPQSLGEANVKLVIDAMLPGQTVLNKAISVINVYKKEIHVHAGTKIQFVDLFSILAEPKEEPLYIPADQDPNTN